MQQYRQWLHSHTFKITLVAFFLMALTPIPLYFAVIHQATAWMFFLLSCFISGNILTLLVR